MATFYLALSLIVAALWSVDGEPRSLSSSPAPLSDATPASLRHDDDDGGGDGNGTHAAVGSPTSSLMTHLPTLKIIVIFTCVVTGALITCLLFKVARSGRRIRKYDIITTPAERVEMAPLNDENDDEDDSTLFDVNYR